MASTVLPWQTRLRRVYDDVLLPVATGDAEDGDESGRDSVANQRASRSGDNPALEHALDLAERYDATLHALSVVDPTVIEPLAIGTHGVREALEQRAEATVETVADRARERGVDVETRIGHGPPAGTITDYAENVDAVVMSTHEREGLKHALLGSVTERVVRTSPAPVLTVPR